MAKHYVYIVKCKDNSLYTGYTTNVEHVLRRIMQEKGLNILKQDVR